MGTIGAGIWDDDVAQDLKVDLKDAYAFNDDETALQEIFRVYNSFISDENSDDYPVFFYALADWLWDKGRLPENIKLKVIEMIDKKEGMERFYETGDESLINQRINIINCLKKKLNEIQPNRKKIISRTGKAGYEVGDIVAFKVVKEQVDTYYYVRDINIEYNHEYIYNNGKIQRNPYVVDFRDKIIAFLCVKINEKKGNVERIKNVPSEKEAIFVQYDYCKISYPTIEELKKCNYIPFFDWTERLMKKVSWKDKLGEKDIINLDALKRCKGKIRFTFLCNAEFAVLPQAYKKGGKYQIFERTKIGRDIEEVKRFLSHRKESGEVNRVNLITFSGLMNYSEYELVRSTLNEE